MSGVLVDTCIRSDALRNKSPKNAEIAEQLRILIDENRAKIIGVIRLELLSGHSDTTKNLLDRRGNLTSDCPTNSQSR